MNRLQVLTSVRAMTRLNFDFRLTTTLIFFTRPLTANSRPAFVRGLNLCNPRERLLGAKGRVRDWACATVFDPNTHLFLDN
jgi:hypothetical protein